MFVSIRISLKLIEITGFRGYRRQIRNPHEKLYRMQSVRPPEDAILMFFDSVHVIFLLRV